MNEPRHKGLLPAGLQDGLPPEAAHEAASMEQFIALVARHGYERVKPPLIEFEESLVAGPGSTLAPQLFRVMDPVSQHMMAVRADITPQIARIVGARMAGMPRPLRLSYAGQVLRVRGSQLRPERQFGQAGIELVGAPPPLADAEVIGLAAATLRALGLSAISIDLTLPTLAPAVCREYGLDDAAAGAVRAALDQKDVAALGAVPGADAAPFQALARAAGEADRALSMLGKLALGREAQSMIEELADVIALVRRNVPDVMLTVDAAEYHGFEYQTGISFTLFAKGVRGEIGRGGRYEIDGGEPATGFSIFSDSLMRGLPAPPPTAKVYLPVGTSPAAVARLQAEGWTTLAGLDAEADPKAEARRLGCSHMFQDDAAHPIGRE